MRPFAEVWLALVAIIILTIIVPQGVTKVDIDYSHRIVGTGTMDSNYLMENPQASEASGAVRGNGDVANNYFFSTNDSSQLAVLERLKLSNKEQAPALKPVKRPESISYPAWPKNPGAFRMIGASWSNDVEVPMQSQVMKNSSAKGLLVNQLGYGPADVGVELNFKGSSTGSTSTSTDISISGQPGLDVNATLLVGLKNNPGFNYHSNWLNSTNVSVKSTIGTQGGTLFEEEGSVSGKSTGLKRISVVPTFGPI